MRRLILLSTAVVAIAACERSAFPTVAGLSGSTGVDTNNTGPITTPLAITPSTVQLTVGTLFQFGTNAPLGLQSEIQWNTLNSGVVTVSPTGLVSAVAPGSATVTARFTFDTLHVATATVIVTAATVSKGPGM